MAVETTSIEAAERALADLRDEITAGVTTVTGAELAEAEHAVDLARLHEGGVAKRAAQEAEEARLRRIGELRAEVIALGAEVDIFERFDQAVEALTSLTSTIAARNARLAGLVDELAMQGPLPADLAGVPGSGTARIAGIEIGPLPLARLLGKRAGGPCGRSTSPTPATWRQRPA